MADGERARVVAELVEEHYALLYRFAYRLSGSRADAEDLTQQAFLTAQAKYDQLRDPDKARSWLLTVVRNAFLKGKRKAEYHTFEEFDQFAGPDHAPEIDGIVDGDELQAVLNDLPEEFRTPIVLFYFQELSYKEIAEQMNTPIGTVMSRLSRGKAFLRSRLLHQLGDDAPITTAIDT